MLLSLNNYIKRRTDGFTVLQVHSQELLFLLLIRFFHELCGQVAGAAAAAGLSLSDVAMEAKHAAEMIGTMGVALSVCTLPGQVTSDRLGPGKMELGLGIVGYYLSYLIFKDKILLCLFCMLTFTFLITMTEDTIHRTKILGSADQLFLSSLQINLLGLNIFCFC